MQTALTKKDLKRKNFKAQEFFKSETAKELGVVNYPDKEQEQEILKNLMSTADMMQEIRDLLGHPIVVNSAFRCKEVNDAVGSHDNSQHRIGLACDFVCPEFGSPEEIINFLSSNDFVVDQAFNEGSWVHISRRLPDTKPNRMMFGYYLADSSGKRRFRPLA